MTENLVVLYNIGYQHPESDKPIFKDFSLSLEKGKCHIFLGRSGCGKSTLMRLIAGLIQPISGQVSFPGTDTSQKAWMQFLFQDYDCFPWLTVFDNVHKGSGPAPYPSAHAVEDILKRVGLWEKRDLYPRALSGGMRKRLGFARTLVRRPKLLLLDEPFASLDIALRSDMYDLLQELMAEHNTTILLVSHDLHEALVLGDTMYVLGHQPADIIYRIDNPFQHPRGEEVVQSDFYTGTHKQIADLLKGLT